MRPNFLIMEMFLPSTNSPTTNRVISILDKVTQFSLATFVVFAMFSISITQISFAIGALSWILKVHLTQTWKELRGTMVGIAILCFCLACVLSIITSVDSENSIKLVKKMIQFVIFFWVANTVQDEKQRDALVGLVIVAGVVACVNGILPLLIPSFFSPDSLYGNSRLLGTMSAPATFSGVLMLVGLLALGRSFFHKPKEYWVLGSTGIIGLCLLLSFTRHAWLGYFIGTVFLLFIWNKKYLLGLSLLLAGLLLFAPDRVTDRILSFTNLKDYSLQARISLWKGGWEIFKDHPITGCGYKCVDRIHFQYPDPSGLIAHYRGMHSNILQLLVDTGIVGLGLWIFIWAAYFTEIFKRWRTLTEDASQNYSRAILRAVA
ncbi:MAG TPA: O-antigen ligase family protein [Nitrospina sp.]|nr:O-antigen ligase family protein [Nitrospina sp.]